MDNTERTRINLKLDGLYERVFVVGLDLDDEDGLYESLMDFTREFLLWDKIWMMKMEIPVQIKARYHVKFGCDGAHEGCCKDNVFFGK